MLVINLFLKAGMTELMSIHSIILKRDFACQTSMTLSDIFFLAVVADAETFDLICGTLRDLNRLILI